MSFLPVQLLEPAHQYDSVDDFEAEALDWIGTDPQAALIEIDRELIRVGGLRMFAELAWPQVEADGSWKGNWHIDVICQELENVSRGENLRLGIAVPPRSGKSLLVAVFWPAWDWIEHPGRRWLFASYAQNLSIRDNMMPPTTNYQTPDPECDLDYVPNKARAGQVDVALSNSFGFGGQNDTIIVKRWRGV